MLPNKEQNLRGVLRRRAHKNHALSLTSNKLSIGVVDEEIHGKLAGLLGGRMVVSLEWAW